MKKRLMVLFACFMVLSFGGCGAAKEKVNNYPGDAWKEDDCLSILAIGNSFATNTLWYADQIIKYMGIDNYKISILGKASCTVHLHWTNALKQREIYEFYECDSSHGWTTTHKQTIETGIKSGTWDYIILSHGSDRNTRGGYLVDSNFDELPDLYNYVKTTANPGAKIVWNMTWADGPNSANEDFAELGKDTLLQYNRMLDTVQRVICEKADFDCVLPNATVIQNARTSKLGEDITSDDNHHLSDYGVYTVGMATISQLSGIPIPDDCLKGVMNEDQRLIAIESAKNAIAKPYEITQSKYK